MTNLIAAYQRNEIIEFEKILKVHLMHPNVVNMQLHDVFGCSILAFLLWSPNLLLSWDFSEQQKDNHG